MTQPVGSVRVTAEADASDFDKEINRTVREAMRGVVSQVMAGMKRVNTETAKVDGKGFKQLEKDAESAAKAVERAAVAAAAAAKATSDAKDREADAAGRARVAEEALNRARSGGDQSKILAAEERLAAARRAAERATRDAADAEQKATRQAEQLAAADLRAAAAARLLANAQDDVADSSRRSAKATEDTSKIIKGGFAAIGAEAKTTAAKISLLSVPLVAAAGAAASLGVAFAGIGALAAPAFAVAKLGAEGFAEAASAAADSLGRVQDAVGQTFKDELTGTFDALGNRLEEFTGQFQDIAKSMSNLFKEASGVLLDPANTDALNTILDGTQTFLDQLGPGIKALTQGFVDFGAAAGRSAEVLGGAFNSVIQGIGETLSELASDGSLELLFNNGAKALEGFGQLLDPIITLFVRLGGVVGDDLGRIFSSLGDTITNITEPLTHIADVFSGALADAMPGVGKAIEGIVVALDALTPILPVLGQVLGILGGAFGDIMTALAPAISQIASAFADALAPVLPVIASLFEKLAPIIGKLGTFFAETLAPILGIIGQALLDILPALEPLIDAFGQLVDAILPPLSALFEKLTPVLSFLVGIIADVVKWVANLVTGFIGLLTDILPGIIEFFTSIPDKIGGAFDALVGFFADLPGNILEFFSDLGSDIVDFFLGLPETLLDALGTLGEALLGFFVGLPIVLIQGLGDLGGQLITWFGEQWTAFTDALPGILESIGTFFIELPGRIVGWLGDLASGIGSWFSTQWDNFLIGLPIVIDRIATFFTELPGKVIGWIGDLGGAIGNFFSEQWTNVTTTLGSLIDGLIDFFRNLPGRLRDAAVGLFNGIPDAFKSAYNSLASYWNGLSLTLGPITIDPPFFDPVTIGPYTLSTPDIPLLADGGLAGRRADGTLWGPGTGKSDSILGIDARGIPTARVSNGERVLSIEQTALLKRLLPGFADGGTVGGTSALSTPSDSSEILDLLRQLVDNTQPIGDLASGTDAGGSAFGGATDAFASGGDTDGGPLAGIGDSFTAVGDVATSVTDEQIVPATTAISDAFLATGDTLNVLATEQINPLLQTVADQSTALATTFADATQNQMATAFTNTAASLQSTLDTGINPVMGATQAAVQTTANAFGTGVDMIGQHWQRLKEGTAEPVRWTIANPFNAGVVASWNAVADQIGLTQLAPIPINFASGGFVGRISGPGGPTSDSISGFVRNNSFILRAAAARAAGLDNLDRFAKSFGNGGNGTDLVPVNLSNGEVALPPEAVAFVGLRNLQRFNDNPGDPQGMFPDVRKVGVRRSGGGLAQGSPAWEQLKRAYDWARAQDGKPYILGGSLPTDGGTDCSGFMSGIGNVIQGGNGMRQWSTMDFNGGGNGQSPSGPQGFVAGLAAGFSIGVVNGGAAGGHTAGTIGGVDGMPAVNVESGGSHGDVAFGSRGAVGADNGQFPTQYHLPLGPDGTFVSGGTAGSVDMGAVVKAKIDPIWERVVSALAARAAGGMVEQLPTEITGKLHEATVSTLVEKARAILGSGVAGDVESYRPIVEMLLRAYNQDLSNTDVTLRRMQQESGGNPTIVNTTDINWQNGTPSVGLMQVIGPTYGSYKDPSYDKGPYSYNVSTDPAANISASMRYALATYPSLQAAYGRAGGYAFGGLVRAGLFDTGGMLASGGVAVNQSGQPERVLSPEQTKAFDQLIAAITGQNISIDWVGLEDAVRLFAKDCRENSDQQEQNTKATKDLQRDLSGTSPGLASAIQAAGELSGDLMSVLDTSGLFAGRTITLTAEEVRQKQIEEWQKFLDDLRAESKDQSGASTTSSGGTSGGKTFDLGGVISGPGLFASGTALPERVLSPQQTQAFEALVAAITAPQIGVPSLTDRQGRELRPTMTAGDINFTINEARSAKATGRQVQNHLLSLLDR